MTDLVAFLTARVNERQSLIMRTVQKGKAGDQLDRADLATQTEMRIRGLGTVELESINRMIREVEATRLIVEAHETTVTDRVAGFPLYGGDYWCEICHVPGGEPGQTWCRTLRLLALPYADHPDYRREWRP
ncbi:DUF6221 family protein [Amycolatopsis sp. 195334CR]|uniref:DUF6221 family protein n=1 Tax=Amycolatopsis sp. 195334CR TaxID=2814588 RepID=UPI001A8E8FDB|nr:DUF6221 family protein [Amycolatopsis sp. 195334CR]MBN6037447.1 hypothetical protein [Amycolatopsis sp. 195334CR]